MNIHLSLDIETVSTKVNAGVLAIGCTPINNSNVPEFYQVASFPDIQKNQKLYKCHICKDTIDWWNKQPLNIYKENFPAKSEITQYDLFYAFSSYLVSLKSFEQGEKIDNIFIWANSPSFDCEILSNRLEHFGLLNKFVWNFRNFRDLRTLKALSISAHPEQVKLIPDRAKQHTALYDAQFQTSEILLCFAMLDLELE